MKTEKGTLISWNNDKGYGFIRPYNNTKDIFFHVKSLPHYQRRPKVKDVLMYEVGIDEKQQHYAHSVKIKGIAWSYFTIIWPSMTLLFGLYVYFVLQQKLSFHPLAIYAGMSLLTIRAYSRDKRAARLGTWRTSELRLHIFEMLGGWPGALLAQRCYRHKSRKIKYQIIFWLIITSHGVLWYYALTHQDIYRPYQQAVTEKARSFVNQARKKILHLSEMINSEDALTNVDHAETTEPVKIGRRSIIIPDKQLHIVKGVVKEIRPREGVIVSLQLGTGILDKSTLVNDFPTRFMQGECIQVAIHTIKMRRNTERIELILVENNGT
ncbi:DUF1294 domain-containing protein [Desulfobacula sp.]|uniref:DUF1294 domain-containing protein n=1 Tax=Desulfobacula sp. TaxID=2593537 RepID=UPI00261EF7E7|nr:DUF1294 domain-containing protein [Desulfobacula sp.]